MMDYGGSLRDFREQVDDNLDLDDARHRDALLSWLNAWGCRIALISLQELSQELAAWHPKARRQLPGSADRLQDLDDALLEKFVDLFDHLSGLRPREGIRKLGPTAASKTLFALRPHAFVPWDRAIRDEFQAEGTGESYVSFLKRASGDLRQLSRQCSGHGFDLAALPERIGRHGATGAQLIGEYYWVTITRKAKPPGRSTLREWSDWSCDHPAEAFMPVGDEH